MSGEKEAVRRYQQRVAGNGTTGDEFQFIETVPATSYDAVVRDNEALTQERDRLRRAAYAWRVCANVQRFCRECGETSIAVCSEHADLWKDAEDADAALTRSST